MATIVIIEDDVPLRTAIAQALRADFHDVHASGSVVRGRQLIGAVRPGLVIADYRLPDGQAPDIAEAAKAVPSAVLVVTSYGEGELDAACRGWPVLRKPFPLLELRREAALLLHGEAVGRSGVLRPPVWSLGR